MVNHVHSGDLPATDGDPLDALALDCGIEPAFVDAHGNERKTSTQTKRALLAAMRIEAQTDEQVRAALAARVDERWHRALPHALVATFGRPLDVPIVVAHGTPALRWTLTLENGEIRHGQADLAGSPISESEPTRTPARERRVVRLATDVPLGYHRLRLEGSADELALIVSPESCWLPDSVSNGQRLSGIAVQLYLLRSAANWGIGDFTDLRTLVEPMSALGIDVVGLNPLHALFPDDPEHASPYSPQSRLLLNTLNIDVTAVPGFAKCAEVQALLASPDFSASLAACRAAAHVDYSTVARLKYAMLRPLFDAFAHADETSRAAFERYRADASPALARAFLFAALRAHFAALDHAGAGWQHWPAEYRDPASAAVATFAREHEADLSFIIWLQWIADSQLAGVAEAARSMRVGLYHDLAVGADPAGAETWSNARAVIDSARVGAPPDIYNPAGQNWGLPPFDPDELRREGYATFIELVRANMRYAGALRIDHVMALAHLYWIPAGAEPGDGAYVQYPLEDLVGIIALESHRARCLVVGEDLGTVPAGFRERMAAANILSYRVLFFERDASGEFTAPQRYPRSAIGVLGSHDLPTLRAWWDGSDIRLRRRLGLYSDTPAVESQRARRRDERDAFVRALAAAGLIADDVELDADALFVAAHAFLAQTAAALMMAQLDDIAGETDPVNVPTTSDEHPNWRRRQTLAIEDLQTQPRFQALLAVLRVAGRLRATAGPTTPVTAAAATVRGDERERQATAQPIGSV